MKYFVFVIDNVTGSLITSLSTYSCNDFMALRFAVRNNYTVVTTNIDKTRTSQTIEYRVIS